MNKPDATPLVIGLIAVVAYLIYLNLQYYSTINYLILTSY